MKAILKIGIKIFNVIYSLMKLLPQQKKAVFISRQGDSPSLDFKILKNKTNELYPEYKTVMLCKTMGNTVSSYISYFFHMFKQMYHIATSEIVILDSYCILISILDHRKSLLIIQIWHSIGTMKKFGYSILDMEEGSSSDIAHTMKMHRNYDYIFAAGEGYRSHLAEGFGYPEEQVKVMPLPRVEVLKDSSYACDITKKIYTTYPVMTKKTNIVYVPTFRKTNDEDFNAALKALCAAIDDDRFNLIIKPHPLTDLSGFSYPNIIIDKQYSSFDMLFAADIVVSDYSCIIYEAAILKKPIYFYDYDYDTYMDSRDTYMDYLNEVPGPVCKKADELMATIGNGSYDYDRLNDFLNRYVYTGSAHETEDMVRFIFDHRKHIY